MNKNLLIRALMLVGASVMLMIPFAKTPVNAEPADVLTVQDSGTEDTIHPQDLEKEPPFDDGQIESAAKCVWGEARGVESRMEQAAIVWVFLNRVDATGKTLGEVVAEPYQFHYNDAFPTVDDFGRDLEELVRDVVDRWEQEHNLQPNVGRVIPRDYLWFGGDGYRNYFRNDYNFGGKIWDWSLPDPYET